MDKGNTQNGLHQNHEYTIVTHTTLTAPIAITMGEPAGIGPDIILLLCHDKPTLFEHQQITIIGSRSLLQDRAKQLGLSFNHHLSIIDVPLNASCQAGLLEKKNSPSVIQSLTIAAKGCLSGEFSAIVTAPIHKGILNEADFRYAGHTDFFTKIAGVDRTVMMLMTDQLKVALFTDHIPLRAVPDKMTSAALSRCLEILIADFQKYFNLKHPRVLVCGLNPHAGEDGYIGIEEQSIMRPTLENFRKKGYSMIGPIAADVAFTKNTRDKADVILAMYHDQGLPTLKYTGFHQAINVTLGLPFIRTSVDHGTALDIAGSKQADYNSLLQALLLAKQMVEHSHEFASCT